MRFVRWMSIVVVVTAIAVLAPAAEAETGPVTGSAALSSNAPAALGPVGTFQVLSPARLLDTRGAGSTVDGAEMGGGAVVAGTTRSLPVLGRGGVPASGVSAVALNVTVAGPVSAGFLTAFPHGEAVPVTSNLNYSIGQTVANLVVVKIGAGGAVDLDVQYGTTHVIADVAGWFPTSSDFTSVSPARVLDTRATGSTVDGVEVAGGAVGAGTTRSLPVLGRGGVPASGVSAVVLNVTVAGPVSAGFLTAFPHGDAVPLASNLNYSAGQTVPNLVVVGVGTDGAVDLSVKYGTTHVIADVAGWFAEGATFTSFAPRRLLDTRPGAPTVDGQESGGGSVGPGATRSLPVLGRGGVPASGVSAVVLNVTVVDPTSAGYVTVFPSGEPRPTASNVNFPAGRTVPNLVFAKVGGDGAVDLFNASGSAHVVVDVAGWFPTASPTAVAAGGSHTCSLVADRTLRCWGKGQYGALGNGAAVEADLPVTVKDITTATAVASGDSGFSCALLADGTVRCWGHNDQGQVGDGTTSDRSVPVPVSGITTAIAISAGASHACAVLADGTVRCWGANVSGQLGNGSTSGSPVPVLAEGVADATAVSAASMQTCVVIEGGTVRCWGDNYFGSLGDGTTTSSSTAVVVQGVDTAVAVAGGTGQQCALLLDHTVRCWGLGASGRLGNGGTTSSSIPVAVQGITTAVAISAGAARPARCWPITRSPAGGATATANWVMAP